MFLNYAILNSIDIKINAIFLRFMFCNLLFFATRQIQKTGIF